MTTLEKLEELVYVGFKETDKKWQETMARLDKMSKDTDKKIGDITGKWGHFVEGLVAPAVVRLFAERGIVVTDLGRREERQRGDEGIEIDLLAKNGEYVVLIEVKSTLGVDDVNEHLERLEKFTRFFPEYDDLKIVGAVAGIVVPKNVSRFAYQKGLFVIAQSGETVKLLNDAKFMPKVWQQGTVSSTARQRASQTGTNDAD